MPNDKFEINTIQGSKGVPAKTDVITPSTRRISLEGRSNAFKSGKFAKLISPVCDSCYLRSEESGGSGQCPEYEEGAVCSIDKKLRQVIDQYDTRKEEDIKEILMLQAQDVLLRVQKCTIQANMDGNYLDKTYLSNQQALMNILTMCNNLNRQMKVTVEQTETFDKSGELQEIGRMLRAESLGVDQK